MRVPAELVKKPLLLLAVLLGIGLLALPAWSQEPDSEDQTQVDEEAADESADEATVDEESSDEAQSGDAEESEAAAESVDDPSADEAESTQEAASGEEEESAADAGDGGAAQSVDETEPAEEAAPAQAAEEPPASATPPEPGPSSVAVESWSITLNTPMGVRESELTMRKPAGGAVVATFHTDGGESRVPVQFAGNNLSWAWDVTNPMPLQFKCEATIQGEQMAGICTMGNFGEANLSGSRK